MTATQPEKLPLIGRDRFIIEKLAKTLHGAASRVGDYTPVREIPRGNYFEVLLVDGYVAKVTVELDRIDHDLKPDPPAKS